jgi:hypothetical protein
MMNPDGHSEVSHCASQPDLIRASAKDSDVHLHYLSLEFCTSALYCDILGADVLSPGPMERDRMRQMLLLLVAIFSVAMAGAVGQSTVQAEQLTDSKFRELLNELQPAGNEPWRTIPWKIALLDAQRNAATENKPIFIWAMDGHPLGCT